MTVTNEEYQQLFKEVCEKFEGRCFKCNSSLFIRYAKFVYNKSNESITVTSEKITSSHREASGETTYYTISKNYFQLSLYDSMKRLTEVNEKIDAIEISNAEYEEAAFAIIRRV